MQPEKCANECEFWGFASLARKLPPLLKVCEYDYVEMIKMFLSNTKTNVNEAIYVRTLMGDAYMETSLTIAIQEDIIDAGSNQE